MLVGWALAALAGCAAQKDDPEIRNVSTVTYRCADGTVLAIWFEPESAIVSEANGSTLILPQKPSGSGFSYGTDEVELRGKGDEATWTAAPRAPTSCKADS